MTTPSHTAAETMKLNDAKGALERVCSGAGLDPPSRYYSPSFVDHVNDLQFSGLEGAERSVELYKAAFSEMTIKVAEQLVEGDRIASRFVVKAKCYERWVSFNGITISHFKDGLIVEDWSVTDTLGMLRQLGVLRSVLLGLRQWRALMQVGGGSRKSRSTTCPHTAPVDSRT